MEIGNLKTQSTSSHSAELLESVVIEQTNTTRKIVEAVFNNEKTDLGETVSICITHQRKNNKDEWEKIESKGLSKLKAGELAKLELHSSATKKLYDFLVAFYKMSHEKAIFFGEQEFTLEKADNIVRVPKERKLVIDRLIDANFGEEFWKELSAASPVSATKFSLERIQANRKESLAEFGNNIDNKDKDERYWQNYFVKNKWIFGYGLNYQFLNLIQSQPNYGGSSYSGKGGQRGDYLLNTEAAAKFTVLVEIKTPTTPLLACDSKNQNIEYRNGAWLLSSKLLGALTQLQVNVSKWSFQSQIKPNPDLLETNSIFTMQPKGILVIGNLGDFLDDQDKINCFEIFRRNITNPEIVTFDELYKRANFIVDNYETE